MARLLEIGMTNAVIAMLLAILVWAVTRRMRQPAFVHLLWVLVLVKLITPPLLPIPWSVGPAMAMTNRLAAAPAAIPAPPASPLPAELAPSDVVASAPVEIVEIPAKMPTAIRPAASSPPPSINWVDWLGGLWLAGSAIWLLIAVRRMTQFHFALNLAKEPTVELQSMADDVAAKVGVRRFRVRVTAGRLSPLVWPIGMPTIVVPQDLVDILTELELQAILTHEFAHLRRKDHWVRWLEFVAMALYWWNPVVWFVRRRIQQSEELACDAWVVRENPNTANAYANALFQAVEVATGALRPAPLVASRVTSGGDLKERIEHVMNATWSAGLSKGSCWALSLAALCALPLSMMSVSAQQVGGLPPRDRAASVPGVLEPVGAPPQKSDVPNSEHEQLAASQVIDDAAVVGEQVKFLEQQFNQIDALYQSGAPGGTVDRQAMAGFELARARGELALVAGNRAEAADQFAKAAGFAETALQATDAAYRANRVTLDALMQASNNLTDTRRRLIQLRRPPAAAPKSSATEDFQAELRRALAEQASSESSTASLAYHRKAMEQQKGSIDRLQRLADKQVVSASELARAKAEYELLVEALRQAERKLESRKLMVQLAKVELAQAIEANAQTPGAISELEVRRKKVLVDLAKAKVRELGE